MKNHFVAALAVVFCTASFAAQARDAQSAVLSAAQISKIERLVAAAMAQQKMVAVSVAVGVGDQGIWSAGYGKADLENDVPASAETRYRTASVTKWMTASAVMRLVELGKLDLDSAPQKYCTTYPQKQWPMTVRQLLNHTAGVRHYYGDNGEPKDTPQQRAALEALITKEQAGQHLRYTDAATPIAVFASDPLVFQPGTRYLYTSLGYRLLGCVIEGAAGESYRKWMRDAVFDPAGMNTMVEDDAYALIPHRVSGYALTDAGKPRRTDFRDVSENIAAGGYLSTAADMVRFALAFDAGRLVNAKSLDQMLAQPKLPWDNADSYYGFGVRVWDTKKLAALHGRKLLTHSGSQNGTSTYLLLVPQDHIAVAVMSNTDDVELADLGRAVVAESLPGG